MYYQRSIRRLKKWVDFKIEKINGIETIITADWRIRCSGKLDIYNNDYTLLHEIFGEQQYHFHLPSNSEKTVVIDIGMNTGCASIYFALRDDVVAVYGFEPVKKTYDNAQFNFSLNPHIINKITSFNYGLGDSDKECDVAYHAGISGSVSTVLPLSDQVSKSVVNELQFVTIKIKDATPDVRHIADSHPQQKIVMKCDCEGGEKEIFQSLDASGLLKRISIIVMEVHGELDADIGAILSKNEFVYFKLNQLPDLFLIHAVNSSIIGG